MRIVYRRSATQHIIEQHAYIARDNPTGAQTAVRKIQSTISRLESFPYSGTKGAVAGTYELVVPRLPYIVIYRVHMNYVEILAVFHTSQDPDTK